MGMNGLGSLVEGLAQGLQQERQFIEQRKTMEMQRDAAAFQAKMLKHQLDKQDQQAALMGQLPPEMQMIMQSFPEMGAMMLLQQGGMPQQRPAFEAPAPFVPGGPAPVMPTLPQAGSGPVNLQPGGGGPGLGEPSSIFNNPMMRGPLKKMGFEGSTRTELDENTGKVYKYDVDPVYQKEVPGSRTLVDMKNFNAEAQNKQFSQEMDLRKEYTTASKKFIDTRDAFASLEEFAASDSAAGDVAMIYKFMTTIDPSSSVKEGEVAMAKNAQGVPEKVRNYYNMAIKGTALTPEQRQDFLKQARNIYDKQLKSQAQLMKRYKETAASYGLDPNKVVMDFTKGVVSEPGAKAAPGGGAAPDLYKQYGLTPPR